MIDTASKLFHVQIRPVAGLHTWHPSVTTYDVFDGATKLGRIYLDMHPREGKDKWFSTQPLTAGARGRAAARRRAGVQLSRAVRRATRA